MAQDGNVLKVKFAKSPHYVDIHVTGVFGGINPLGELVFDLTEDIRVLPEKGEIVVPEGGGKVKENFEPPEFDIIRVCHARVTVPMSAVPSIIEWLQEKFQQFETTARQQREQAPE